MKKYLLLAVLAVGLSVSLYFYVKPVPVLSVEKLESPDADTILAYEYAEQFGDLFQKATCYCGCNHNEIHDSLHTCFLSDHGQHCHICIEEALEIGYGKE